ncbi:wings apart-like protein regulation of heterochromatin-domain-containing protein [Aspergillus novoparasiticus]|uniref:Wings apart-like protein regulation of heterochromatin-domain-containing protein n=1 Tax=Aspergillus novoparasiticus TaxID=986946 RepID=A0A5N6E9V2_9EURO|nr:wings apart-like protein regulation of heterochromatin-domain-containing protein [Aspergillus novoparasiticus]
MREKTKRLVTYGKPSSRKSLNLKDRVKEASTTPIISSEAEGSNTCPCSSTLTRSPRSDSQQICGVDSLDHIPDAHISGSQNSHGKAYDVTGTKRRKLLRKEAQQTQEPSASAGSHVGSTFAHDSSTMFGETGSSNCVRANEALHMAQARGQSDACSLPTEAQADPEKNEQAPTEMTYMLQSSRDRMFSLKTDRLSTSYLSGMNATGHQTVQPILRKRLVDSLNTTEEVSVDCVPDRECQPDCQTSSSHIRKGTDGQRTAYMNRSKASGTDNIQQSTNSRPLASGRPRVTYAHQRSFLNDAYVLGHTEEPGLLVSSTCRNLRQPQPSSGLLSQTYLHVEDEESLDNRPVRSIHELRQAGDNARFWETVDLIFEDIEDPHNSASDVCNGFVQLCTKLMEPRFLDRFSEAGFDERLVKCMTGGGFDIVSITLALCAYRLICLSSSFSSILPTPMWSKLLDKSPTLLDVQDDISVTAKQRSIGLSKAVQASLKSLLPRLSLAIYGEQPISTISPRLLILVNLQKSLTVYQEKGTSVNIPASLLTLIIELLSPAACENAKFPLPFERYQTLVLALSILENYTILSGPLDPDCCNSLRSLTQCYKFLYPNQSDQSRQILILYIRVLLNLTNKDSSLCEECCRTEIVGGLVKVIISEFCAVPEENTGKENSSLDAVILALGALINLTEKSESSRAIFLESTSNSESFLDLLLQQFSTSISSVPQAHSVPEVQHNVAIGYLSILLVTLCLNHMALAQVKVSLDGKGLAAALSTAQEFLRYYQKVEKDSRLFEARHGDGAELTPRLERIICQIREEERQ